MLKFIELVNPFKYTKAQKDIRVRKERIRKLEETSSNLETKTIEAKNKVHEYSIRLEQTVNEALNRFDHE